MALVSSLMIKPGLLWEVANLMPFKVSESPEFLFLNSIWKAEIDLMTDRDRSTGDLMLNINLRNLCEIKPPQPFEVLTFLEDKKNNVQMKCSKVIVSSRDEILFKISFYALCKKIPGFNMSNDLNILFVFSSSIDLGLNVRRDSSFTHSESMTESKEVSKPRLNIVQCLTWSTKMPVMQQSQTSHAFSLLNSTWKLEMLLVNSQTAFHSAYEVCLKNTCRTSIFPAVEVKHFLDLKEYNAQYKISKPDETSVFNDNLCRTRYDSVFPDAQGFELCNSITVVSIFNPATGLSLIEMPRKITSGLLDCSLCQNNGCFIKENLNQHSTDSQYPVVKLLPQLNSLADDLIMLLDRHFMSDIHLKCRDVLIPAHRAILAARSQLLMSKISANDNNNKNIIVDVSDLDPTILRTLLRYLYTGMILKVLSEDAICELYSASTTYRIPSLQKMCRCYISRSMRESNYIRYMSLALSHNDPELKKAVSLYVILKPSIRQHDSWMKFSREFPQVAEEIDSML